MQHKWNSYTYVICGCASNRYRLHRMSSGFRRVMAVLMPLITIDDGVTALPNNDAVQPAANGRLRDKFGRAITDLRISVTDRCNYKCVYCRTGNEGAQFTELPITDYLRMARVFVSLGVEKIRLTGGEPLLRAGLVEMVQELAGVRTAYLPDGSADDGRSATRHSANDEWTSAGGAGGAFTARGTESGDSEHGCGGRGDVQHDYEGAAEF